MVIRFTPNGWSVSAWVPAISAASCSGSHRAAGDHAEAAGVGDGGDEVPLADPAHRAAHHGDLAAEEARAARPQPVELRPSGEARPGPER